MKFEGTIFCPKPFYGSLHIRGGRIERITASKSPKRISKLILPGLISTHIHTVQTAARNTAENLELLDWLQKIIFPFEAKLTARSTYESALTGMKEATRLGITTILDMATARHTDSVFEAARDFGIRAYIGKALMDRGPKNLVEEDPLEEIPYLLNRWHRKEKGRLHVTLCPRFVLSCSEGLLRQVGEISRDLNLLHHTHVSENKKECAWIERHYGKSNIEVLDQLRTLNAHTILAHGVHLSAKDRRILKKRKVSISHCPTSNLKLASGIADIRAMKGINLSIGVDGAPCNNKLDPFFEMRLAHLLSRSLHGLKGVSAKSILEMATMGGARALKAEKEIGSLEVGKRADLLVMKVPEGVTFNPHFPYESLLHSMGACDIDSTFVDGRRLGHSSPN